MFISLKIRLVGSFKEKAEAIIALNPSLASLIQRSEYNRRLFFQLLVVKVM